MEKTEREIEKLLTDGIKRKGGIAFKFVSPNNVGMPDRIIVLPNGRIEFAELKAAKGRLSAEQRIQIQRLRKIGATVHVLTGEDEVRTYIEEV